MKDIPRRGSVLAAHPTSRGFGWVVFDGPVSPVAWGIASARPNRSSRSLARFERILARYTPAVFVLEDFEYPSAKRAERVKELCGQMQHLAEGSGVRTLTYPKHLIRSLFGNDASLTRHQIAEVVAARVEDFSHRLPRKRPLGSAEDARQSLFDAAALAMVYFAKQSEPPPRAHSGVSE